MDKQEQPSFLRFSLHPEYYHPSSSFLIPIIDNKQTFSRYDMYLL